MNHPPILYWSRNRDLDDVVKRRGFPMVRVEMIHQWQLAKYEEDASGQRTGRYAIDAENMWPYAQNLSGQGGVMIVNLEHDARHAARYGDGLVAYDPRRSTPEEIARTVELVNDVMLPMEIMAPSMLRTVTLSCNLPYFRFGREGEAGWMRAADRLTDLGMFARQTAHFIDCWATDDNPQGDWMIARPAIGARAAVDEGQFEQSVRLARHLPTLPIIMQWAPATRNGVPMRPGILARNVHHNLESAPHVDPFLWITGVQAFDGRTNPDGSVKIVDWPQGTPEGDYLIRELERIFVTGSSVLVGQASRKVEASA